MQIRSKIEYTYISTTLRHWYTQANKSGRANYIALVCDHIALVRILYAIYSVEQ